MIVKIQLSLHTSDGVPRCLIYDETHEFTYEGGLNKDVIEAMAGRPKAYFEAKMTPEGLEIGDEVDEQDW